MKKLELKNLKVKKMTKEEQSNVKGGNSSGFNCTWQGGTAACGNNPSQWPLSCSVPSAD